MTEPLELTVSPGFSDYVAASQRVFRLALACLSQPCRLMEIDRDLLLPGAPLPPAPAFLALTLLDQATLVWLSPSWRKAESWLRFHRGCPVDDRPDKAAFVLAASLTELPPLASLNQGTDRYPDSSATVILGSTLSLGGQNSLTAEGPGIDGSLVFQGHSLNHDFLTQWRNNRDGYPLGVDVFLVGDFHLAGLPRSVSLEGRSSREGRSCM